MRVENSSPRRGDQRPYAKGMNRKRLSGFTLMELMVGVAIIGLLGSIAYPSYLAQGLKARRSDGQVALLTAADEIERHYADRETYDGYAPDTNSPEQHYTLAATIAAAGSQYTLSATPIRSDPECNVLSIDYQGTKAVTGTADAEDCW